MNMKKVMSWKRIQYNVAIKPVCSLHSYIIPFQDSPVHALQRVDREM